MEKARLQLDTRATFLSNEMQKELIWRHTTRQTVQRRYSSLEYNRKNTTRAAAGVAERITSRVKKEWRSFSFARLANTADYPDVSRNNKNSRLSLAGVEVFPDCSYIAYGWLNGREPPVLNSEPVGHAAEECMWWKW